MNRTRTLLFLALLCLSAHSARAVVPSYRLDVVFTYETTTTLRGASDAGHFVGDQVVAGFLQPFLATLEDGVTTLPLPSGYLTGSALDVNDAGVVVGMVHDGGLPFDLGEPAVWTPQPGGGYTVEVLAVPATVFAAGSDRATNGGQAVAINNAGTIVGWSRIQGFQGGPTTLLSTTEDPVDLGSMGFQATVRDINDNDVIVGGGLRMDLGTGEITELGLPDPVGTVGFTDVIAFAVNDQDEAVVAANLASVVTENYLTYLHNDTDGYIRLNPAQLPSRFVGFYDNNDQGDVSASGGILFRSEDTLVNDYESLLEPAFSDWSVDLGFIDDQRRVYTTGFDSASGTNAVVLLTPISISTSAPPVRALDLTVAPNPFNPRTSVRFTVPSVADAQLDVFDARGRHVRTLLEGRVEAGEHRVVWDGRGDGGGLAASGVYHARLRAGSTTETIRMVLVR